MSGDTTWRPSATLAWRHATGDATGASTAAFGASAFTVLGAPVTKDAAVVKAGLGVDLSKSGRAWLAYDGVLGKNGRSDGVSLGAAFSF